MVVIAVIFFHVSRVGAEGTPVPLGTTMAALFYYTNYYDLAWGMDPYKVIPFGICWSLAIEEHFYLLWPLVIKFFIKYPAQTSGWHSRGLRHRPRVAGNRSLGPGLIGRVHGHGHGHAHRLNSLWSAAPRSFRVALESDGRQYSNEFEPFRSSGSSFSCSASPFAARVFARRSGTRFRVWR